MIKLEKDTYTKDEVEELIKPVEKEINDLKAIAVEGNKAIEKVKELEKSNLSNTIKLEMTKAGLDESIFDLVDSPDVKTAQAKINKLVELKKAHKIDNSYKPEDRKKQDSEYEAAEKNGDIAGMLKTKFSKLFE
jgi:hypothetical protein